MKYFDMSDHVAALLPDFTGGELEPPSDLVTFDQTHHSFHVSWTTPDGPVERFLVSYTKTAGGPVQEV